MKIFKQMLTTIAMLLCSIIANAHDFEVDGIYYNITGNNTVEVTYKGNYYEEYSNEYFGYIGIPSEICFGDNFYYVTAIGESAFRECDVTELYIGYHQIEIKNNAFYDCINLTNINWESIIKIGDSAFNGCNALEELTLYYTDIIGMEAFSNCNNIKSITLNDINIISNGCFNSCTQLKEVVISANSIGINPFWGCNQLEKIVIANDNKKYDSRNNCNAIIETATNTLISGCKTTVIPNDIEIIGNNAFARIESLTSINLPESVNIIEWQAFYDTGIKSITIPNNVKEIGSIAFSNKNLQHIICKCKKPPLLTRSDYGGLGPIADSNVTLYVPYGTKAIYTATDGWKDFTNIVEIKSTYNVTFIIDDSIFATDSIVEGDKITYPEVPEKEGYSFKWDTIIDIMPSNDITINGKYIPNSYLITYKVDGEIYVTDSIKYGATIEPIAEPTKEGHTFSGWSEIPETMPANDVVIEGTFSINSYTVTYKVNGEVYKTETVEYGATIVPIEAPTKEGHTFSGWSEIPETMPANDVVIEGTFSINSYTVTYKVNGEVYKTKTVEYGATIVPIEAPTKEGHTFSGWSETPETMPANDIVIEGSFSINTYNITYKVDGEIYATDSIKFGATIEPIEAPTKEGHTFSGWSEIPETMPAKDVVVEGTFSINSYTVTYKVDGEVYKTETIEYGATITPIAAPTKEGHTFSGWSEIPETMPANDVVIEGSFSINSYSVTYKVDGEIYATDSIKFGATIVPIEEPTKEGHTFSGWIDIPETMPANDIVIEGSFSVNSYLLTYKVDGEIYATYSIKYGATIEPIEAPTKEGHTFSGWSEIPATMPANDVIIEGTFSINSYTVTFMVDGEVYETMTVEYGAEIELPTPPEKEGYIFTGWIGVPATMPAEDIVIEGRFEVDTTGINAVILDLEKNEVYNLKGQRITESENLTRGIYIVNGKKVYIK